MDDKPDTTEVGKKPRRRWYQFSLRTLLIGIVLLAIPMSYVGSYYRLSRRGIREAQANGEQGFLYVPIDEAVATEDLTLHNRLMVFYAPLNWVDCEFFGGMSPIRGVIWRLSS